MGNERDLFLELECHLIMSSFYQVWFSKFLLPMIIRESTNSLITFDFCHLDNNDNFLMKRMKVCGNDVITPLPPTIKRIINFNIEYLNSFDSLIDRLKFYIF